MRLSQLQFSTGGEEKNPVIAEDWTADHCVGKQAQQPLCHHSPLLNTINSKWLQQTLDVQKNNMIVSLYEHIYFKVILEM